MCRILFIGNSHTYLHYMPLLLAEMARTVGHTITTAQSVGEGASLAWHHNHSETIDLVTRGKWTHVVLQERSRGPLEDKTSMQLHAHFFDKTIRKTGARTVFFMTWAARGAGQAIIANTYEDIAHECDAMLAPVGKAWELIQSHPDFPDLYHQDGRHASKAGAYLSACVFYTLLCDDSPIGLSNVVEKDGRLLANLLVEDARCLQEAARESVSIYGTT